MLTEFQIVSFCASANIPVPGYRSWKSHVARKLFLDVMEVLCSVVDDFLEKRSYFFDHPEGRAFSLISDSGKACSSFLQKLLVEEDSEKISELISSCKEKILATRDLYMCSDYF